MLKVNPHAALWSPDTAHLTRRHTHTLTHCGVFWVTPVGSESREGPKIKFKVRLFLEHLKNKPGFTKLLREKEKPSFADLDASSSASPQLEHLMGLLVGGASVSGDGGGS